MKTCFLLPFFLVSLFGLSAQSEKGATPLSSPQGTTPHSTRAVVIGISDYQDTHIPDLRFADKDAEAFAEWLKGPGGGNLPKENLRLLVNQSATLGQIMGALTWLIEETQEGDQVILYFSGHGDVESKLFGQAGYLLCYDTPAQTYIAGGLAVDVMQKIIASLSLLNKGRVLLITDACRAGKLAGSDIGGAQLTNANLAQRFANEIKLLSCQPNEQSLEGEQWGGGRGVFSYHLVSGLKGLADQNADGSVSLLETIGYLQQRVTAETAPVSQVPLAVGNMLERLALVDSVTLAEIRSLQSQTPQFARHSQRVGDWMAGTDSVGRALVQSFEQALAEGRLLEPVGDCAGDYYDQLSARETPLVVQNHLRRNLASALHDEVQQALNAILEADPVEVNTWKFSRDKYAMYPKYLDKAIQLLGKDHYMYNTLRVKQLFFEAYGINFSVAGYGGNIDPESKEISRRLLHEALQYDSAASYVYYLIGNTWTGTFNRDSLLFYYQRSIDLSPRWVLPYVELAFEIMTPYADPRQAKTIMEKAVALRPDSYIALEMLAWTYQRFDLLDSIKLICARMQALHPQLPNALVTLGYSYAYISKEYPKAVSYFQQALALDSNSTWYLKYPLADCYFFMRNHAKGFEILNSIEPEMRALYDPSTFWLVEFYNNSRRYTLADSIVRQAISIQHHVGDLANLYILRAEAQYYLGRFDTARVLIQKAFLTDTTPNHLFSLGYGILGAIAAGEGRYEEAERQFKLAVDYHPELISYASKTLSLRAWCMYGDYMLNRGRQEDAASMYQSVVQKDPGNYLPYHGLARLYAMQRRHDTALDYLEMALDRWYPIPEPILEEPLFKKIRKTKRFSLMMEKHFPELMD